MTKVIAVVLLAALLLTGCTVFAQHNTGKPAAATQKAEIITEEEAKAIALKDAGLTEEQVTGLRAELDRDDGRKEWEVDFRHDGFEYDYTIHAESGKILESDRDRDD